KDWFIGFDVAGIKLDVPADYIERNIHLVMYYSAFQQRPASFRVRDLNLRERKERSLFEWDVVRTWRRGCCLPLFIYHFFYFLFYYYLLLVAVRVERNSHVIG